jgi:hypothetical protein
LSSSPLLLSLVILDLIISHGLLLQALHQLVGGALLLLSLSKGTEPNKFAVLSVAAGLLAILVGELGDV